MLTVTADNSGEPCTRWYSGSGIYRPVWLHIGSQAHIRPDGVRSAHNPISRAMPDACDQLGMYVMDEFADVWYEHKNRFDYASHFEEWHTLAVRSQKKLHVGIRCSGWLTSST